MNIEQIKDLTLAAINVSLTAGEEILEVYGSEFDVDLKEDKSPLTLADQKAHNAIVAVLAKFDLPILSEEGRDISFEERKNWTNYWIVDPLDGTKEFVKRNGEFTVNIALMEGNTPLAGVIYVPVKKILYFGILGWGAYKMESFTSPLTSLTEAQSKGVKLPLENSQSPYKVVGSRSHMSDETSEFIEALKKEHAEIEIVSMGSSLKICLVAEGAAHVYPRFAPTMEWDTAAGQAIAEAAGKEIVARSTMKQMLYNKENLLNDWFIVR